MQNLVKYKCNICGKEIDKSPKKYSFENYWCEDCLRKNHEISKWQNEQFRTPEIVCPWCGHIKTDSWELICDFDDEYECSECEKVFEYERDFKVTYTSRKRKCDYPGGDANE